MRKNFSLTVFLFAVCFSTSQIFAQQFEGSIEFKKFTSIDTVDYVYYVKGDQVRIDEISSDNKTAGTMLVNIKDGTAKSLNPERKLYLDVEQKKPTLPANAKISKGKGTKTIAGYKCNEVIVKNSDQNTIVTFYIAKGDFHFLKGVINALNRKDPITIYYQLLSDIEESFPFYAVESDFAGNTKTVLEVITVNKTKLDQTLFQIPTDFKRFEK